MIDEGMLGNSRRRQHDVHACCLADAAGLIRLGCYERWNSEVLAGICCLAVGCPGPHQRQLVLSLRLHAPIVHRTPGGGSSPCFLTRREGGTTRTRRWPSLRATLGRRLSISRVASSFGFARSPSIRSRTARISKAELCSDNGPADATRLFTTHAYASIACPPAGVGPGAMSLTR